jgi:Ca2+-binding EF-hand superfamily protein
MLVELKQCFMEAYDDNQDGKIDIREVSVQKLKYSVAGTHIEQTRSSFTQITKWFW